MNHEDVPSTPPLRASTEMPEAIHRRAAFWGRWRVTEVTQERSPVLLLRCDCGEVIETLEWTDPSAVLWAREQAAP
mgnify:CR=1 FL=1